MKLLYKTALILYYVLWLIFLVLIYSSLTENHYFLAQVFGKITGIITISISTIVFFTLFLLFLLKTEKRKLYAKIIKLITIPVLGCIPFVIINAAPRQLETTSHILTVQYTAYGCECANWKIIKDNQKKSNVSISEDIFIEPKNDNLILPDSLDCDDLVQLTGKFYTKKGFPACFHSEQFPEKANVFQYISYRIISCK
jgi:hypothetical protein